MLTSRAPHYCLMGSGIGGRGGGDTSQSLFVLLKALPTQDMRDYVTAAGGRRLSFSLSLSAVFLSFIPMLSLPHFVPLDLT